MISERLGEAPWDKEICTVEATMSKRDVLGSPVRKGKRITSSFR